MLKLVTLLCIFNDTFNVFYFNIDIDSFIIALTMLANKFSG